MLKRRKASFPDFRVVTFVALVWLCFTGPDAFAAAPSVGVIVSGDGEMASSGIEAKNAAVLFISNHDADWCVIEDDGGDPSRAVAIAEKLIAQGVGFIVGPIAEKSAKAMRSYVADRNVVWLSLAPERPERGRRPPNYFRIGTSEGRLISKAIDFGKVDLKAKRLRLEVPPQLFVAPDAVKEWNSGMGSSQLGDPGSIFEPQNAVTVVSPERVASMLDGLKQTKVVTYSTFGVRNMSNYRRNGYFVVAVPGGDQTTASRTLARQYVDAFGQTPDRGFAFQTYAALEIVSALRQLSSASARVDALQNKSFKTVIGELDFESDGDSTWQSEAVWAVSGEGMIVAASGGTSCKCALADCCKKDCCKQCKGECD